MFFSAHKSGVKSGSAQLIIFELILPTLIYVLKRQNRISKLQRKPIDAVSDVRMCVGFHQTSQRATQKAFAEKQA
jgi:hypothetical protein